MLNLTQTLYCVILPSLSQKQQLAKLVRIFTKTHRSPRLCVPLTSRRRMRFLRSTTATTFNNFLAVIDYSNDDDDSHAVVSLVRSFVRLFVRLFGRSVEMSDSLAHSLPLTRSLALATFRTAFSINETERPAALVLCAVPRRRRVPEISRIPRHFFATSTRTSQLNFLSATRVLSRFSVRMHDTSLTNTSSQDPSLDTKGHYSLRLFSFSVSPFFSPLEEVIHFILRNPAARSALS